MPRNILTVVVMLLIILSCEISECKAIQVKDMSIRKDGCALRERHNLLGLFDRSTKMKSLNNEMLAKKYLSGMSCQDLATEYDCSKGAIYYRLDSVNVQRRSVSEQSKLSWEQGKFASRYKMPAKQRFETHIKKLNCGCWEWTGKIAKDTGYGHHVTCCNAKHKHHLAHRYSYELYVGKIPEGLCIDHLCRNRKCVNPQHLEPVTMRENILRGNSIAAINSKKTHCHKNHKLSGRNLYITPDGRRQCKKCSAIREYNRRHRKELQNPENSNI